MNEKTATETTTWTAIRKTEGCEWIDTNHLGCREAVEIAAKKTDSLIPGYASANPVVRFAVVQVREILA